MTVFATALFLGLLVLGLPVFLLIWLFWLAMGAPRHPHVPRTRTLPRKD